MFLSRLIMEFCQENCVELIQLGLNAMRLMAIVDQCKQLAVKLGQHTAISDILDPFICSVCVPWFTPCSA